MHYWASPIEAKLCDGQEVALVGAGNSAGQAAVYLASQVDKVWLLVTGRGPRRIDVALSGRAHQGAAQHRGRPANRGHVPGGRGRRPVEGLLAQCRNRSGNVASDPPSVPARRRRPEHRLAGQLRRGARSRRVLSGPASGDERHHLETNRAGIFAIGDVRSGSVKRVASSVGEGAQVVAAIHAVSRARRNAA